MERQPPTLDAGCMRYKPSILNGIFRKKEGKENSNFFFFFGSRFF
jgi:hypothetical protein